MTPHIVENETVRVQHTSLPFGRPSQFPDIKEWIEDDGVTSRLFILTVRDNGISIRSKMRRADMTHDEAQGHNAEAARLLAVIASSHRPHLFFSYETLVYLGHDYLQELYRFLDVESDFVPPLIDANERYLKAPLQEGGPRESIRPSI